MKRKSQAVSVEQALKIVKAGKLIIIVDDEDRENEGDLMVAAEKVTPEVINFMTKHGRGLICMPLTEKRLRKLDIPLMVRDNTAPFQTAFTVSIDEPQNSPS
jgi:3,4-dihydroxy 2-butanone 4-phosphate synthase/GTP cyclohydrolase II